ncbi:PD-(D/E)XK nuclease superfamily protein [Candidatus Mycoplasma mahonii]|uniref:PD-(D/E)XK nuclease superfamily protein n=1 Tax=Candidatus Mycoplasma mahonii TaxID=3004105 RepID=UPI0026EEB3FF|nr:PD-(D/E)XK nuclease superfamily protein [Candidatus Mycoplasma mahonii]WKX02266.1 hypothetical protein O3I44_02580 [Candidatus Mycoplasma mahonii]
MIIKNKGTGAGGSNTNLHGIRFEEDTYLKDWIIKAGFTLEPIKQSTLRSELYKIFEGDKLMAYYGRQGQIYHALKLHNLDQFSNEHISKVLSKKINPDGFILCLARNHLTIFEKKWQQTSGSVDEKIQTGPFKLLMFEKLLRNSGISCQYNYILSPWFQSKVYRNVKEYYEDNKKINIWVDGVNLQDLSIENYIK